MKQFNIKHLTIYKGNGEPEEKYRKELSKLLIQKFGAGPYSDHENARLAITYSFNYFCEQFLSICHNEKSVRFYQFILSQHEQSIEAAFFAGDYDFPDGIDRAYIALYRRILKWILEQACDIELHNNEKSDANFLNRSTKILNELAFIGDMMFTCATMYAEQDMIEDVAEIIFEDDLYVMKHKHHYDFIIREIQQSYGAYSFKHVVEENPVENLQESIHSCFGVQYAQLTTVIQEIHKMNEDKGGQYCGFGWESLPMSVESIFGGDIEQSRILFQGLTLNRDNKQELKDLVCKPQTMYRYLYRPILIWNIEGEDFAVIGINGFTESIIQLTTNAIPWGKAPQEWMVNKCFKAYVHSKEDDHDKWLDDEVEKKLRENNLDFFRNMISIKTDQGILSLNIKGVGEVDFIIIDHDNKKLYLADCKHLQGRYDMMTQKNDFSKFTKGKKPYNQQIKNKVEWLESNLVNFNYHYHNEYSKDVPDISKYAVEGIFIINTPTFYMFNSDYRIYTVDVVVSIINGSFKDPVNTVMVDEKGSILTYNLKYPYFKKPDYVLQDLLDIEEDESEE